MRKKYFLQSFASQICLLLSPALICLASFYFLPFHISPTNKYSVSSLIADYLLSKYFLIRRDTDFLNTLQ